MRRRFVIVNDRMQQSYRYELTAPAGRDFDPEFRPDLTPKEMLELGVFCGKYLTDCRDEFPASWFARAKLSPPVLIAPRAARAAVGGGHGRPGGRSRSRQEKFASL
jgi:hypothetical protein